MLVRAGTYSGIAGAGADCGGSVGACVYGSPKGTATAPITVEAYPGERPVIAAMVSFPSAQWFRFSGFIVDGAQAPEGAEGVSLGNTSGAAPSHVEISYNEIRNFGRGGNHYSQGILHFSGTDDALIGNRIHHIGRQRFYDHGIYLKAGRRVVVANNVISDITGGYGVQIWGDFDDSWVINNTVYGAAASGFIVGGNNDRGRPDRTVRPTTSSPARAGRPTASRATPRGSTSRAAATRPVTTSAGRTPAAPRSTSRSPDRRTTRPPTRGSPTPVAATCTCAPAAPPSTRPRASACCSTPTVTPAAARPTRAPSSSADRIRRVPHALVPRRAWPEIGTRTGPSRRCVPRARR